jgi:flagellar basal-body rod protein FlgF
MEVSLYQAAAAMNAMARWQELIADNLSIASTPGARKQEMSFSAVQAGLVSAVSGSSKHGYIIPSAIAGTNFQQGELIPSGNSTDLGLEGPGLFTVQTPDGQQAYTRNGQFKISPQGQLLTAQGFPVLCASGPIQLDSKKSNPVTVSTTGEVSQGGMIKGKLQIAEFNQPSQLTRLGSGLFRADNPGLQPIDSTNTQVCQGFVEKSNSSPTTEMATLMTAMRMFESNQKVLQMQSERMSREISDLGAPAA